MATDGNGWTEHAIAEEGFEDASEGFAVATMDHLGLSPLHKGDDALYDFYIMGYKRGERFSF